MIRSLLTNDRQGRIFLLLLGSLSAWVARANLLLPPEHLLHISTYTVTLLGKYLTYALLAIAVDLVWGYLGILGLGHGAFFALGGYVMGIPANLAPERVPAAIEALTVFTSAEAQKLYVQNGSRTNPRYSVGSDPDVRRASPIFEAVDAMSWRDELQFWPRPPVPEIVDIVRICGEELHDMLRGITSPRDALRKAQERADALIALKKRK